MSKCQIFYIQKFICYENTTIQPKLNSQKIENICTQILENHSMYCIDMFDNLHLIKVYQHTNLSDLLCTCALLFDVVNMDSWNKKYNVTYIDSFLFIDRHGKVYIGSVIR